MTERSQRPLGDTQQAVLRALHQHQRWYAGCGWVWDTPSGTERLLQSLERRGLVQVRTVEGCLRRQSTSYTLTAAGVAVVESLRGRA